MNVYVKGRTIRSEKVSYDTRTRQYFGDLIKENGRSSRIYNEAGYIDLTPNQPPRYRFHVKDYLGSNRSVVDENGYLLQSAGYYPSGLAYGESGELTEDDRLHNGKELISFNGLYMYNNEARQRDLIFNRFTSIDPLAEKYPSWSPYAVCGNNPVNRIDPTGMIWDDVKEAEKLKDNIDNRMASLNKDISKNQAKLDKGGLSEKQVAKLEGKISEAQNRISNLNTSKADIDVLGADQNNVYALSQTNGGLHQVRQGSDGKVYIETSADALSIHEITHVRQSLDAGGLKFSSNGELLNVGSMASPSKRPEIVSNMEIEGYRMQYSYDLSFPGRTSNLQGIDVHSVGNIMNNGVPVYPLIYDYSKFLKKQQKFIGN